ncbi:hypothetical protein [Brevibacillus agri]|uniref:hypothetical protein n=1 Tax=Brevibacillus agri TaxID=51101 RepID=UPI0018CFC330|nr:hypothetical protein [Brevibacillus agri]
MSESGRIYSQPKRWRFALGDGIWRGSACRLGLWNAYKIGSQPQDLLAAESRLAIFGASGES